MPYEQCLVYSKNEEEHEEHLRLTLQVLREHQLYAKLVDVFVNLECIHLCILCIVTQFLFRDVSIM